MTINMMIKMLYNHVEIVHQILKYKRILLYFLYFPEEYTRDAPKVAPPILLFWLTMLETDVAVL